MATYQGGRFVEAQVRSILAQDLADLELVISDDGSSDGTLGICRRLAAEDARVRVLEPAGDRLGLVANFERAMRHTRGPLIALSDQDDVWHPEKLSALAAKIGEGFDLVACDLRVVGPDGAEIHPSFRRYQRLRVREGHPLRHVLIRNFTSGCGMLMTRDLMDAALPFPEGCDYQDWWLAVVAAARRGGGGIGWLDRPLVDYRQHGGNVVGATGSWASRVRRVLASVGDAADPALYEPALRRVRSYATRPAVFGTDAAREDLAFGIRYFEDQVGRERLPLGRRIRLLRTWLGCQGAPGAANAAFAVAASLAPVTTRRIVRWLGAPQSRTK